MLLRSASNVLLGHSTLSSSQTIAESERFMQHLHAEGLLGVFSLQDHCFGNNLGLMKLFLYDRFSCFFELAIICITHRTAIGKCHKKQRKQRSGSHINVRVLKLPEVRLFFVAPKQHRAIKIECRSSLSHSVHDLRHFLFLSRCPQA